MTLKPAYWGSQPAPENAQAVYSCRAILAGHGLADQHVDIVWDRQYAEPQPLPEAFAAWIDHRLSNWLHNEPRTRKSREFPYGRPAKNGIGYIDPGGDEIFTLDDGIFHAKACANKSHGYLYVLAWMEPTLAKITWQTEFTLASDDRPESYVNFEDSGQAVIAENDPDAKEVGGDGCFFVRLQSWDETEITDPAKIAHQHYKSTEPSMARIEQKPPKYGNHPLFRSLMGRKLRITIETIED